MGRFISPEPNVDAVGFDSGAGLLAFNVYAYCANNPGTFSDLSGEGLTLAFAGGGYLTAAATIGGTNIWNPIGWIIVGVTAVVVVAVVINYSVEVQQTKSLDKTKKESKKTGKEKASDAPSWSKGKKPNNGETAEAFAKRILDEKYGKAKWRRGPASEFSQIKKWAQRSLGLK